MTNYVKIDTVDMHTSCPVASKIKSLEDTIKSLEGTLALTDKQRRSAEDTRSGLLTTIGELEHTLGLVAEQRDSAEKALKLEQEKSRGLKERLAEATYEWQKVSVEVRDLKSIIRNALADLSNELKDALND